MGVNGEAFQLHARICIRYYKSRLRVWTGNETKNHCHHSINLYRKKKSLICFRMWDLFWSIFSLQLFLFNFYPFLQRYLQPHQKGWQLLTFNLCGMWPLTVLTLLTFHLSVFVLPLSPFVLCLVFPCSPFSPLSFPPPFPFPYPFLFCHVFPLLQTSICFFPLLSHFTPPCYVPSPAHSHFLLSLFSPLLCPPHSHICFQTLPRFWPT